MPAFEYLALNPAGKEERGILEADAPRQVRQLLRNRELVPLEVNEVAQKQKTAEKVARKKIVGKAAQNMTRETP